VAGSPQSRSDPYGAPPFVRYAGLFGATPEPQGVATARLPAASDMRQVLVGFPHEGWQRLLVELASYEIFQYVDVPSWSL